MKVRFLVCTGCISLRVQGKERKLTEGKLAIGIVSRQDMFTLQQHDMLSGGCRMCEMMHETSDVFFSGEVVVDGHGKMEVGMTRVEEV